MDPTKPQDEVLYSPEPGERELTLRALLAGCLLGAIITATNMYFGLKTGWTEGGSLLSAILGFSLFQVLRPKSRYTPLECNITHTTASGAGIMAQAAGLLSAIPALKMLGYEPPVYALFLWTASIAFLGVNFAVPLRRQYLDVEKLRFPTGTATAHTILAMYASASAAIARARALAIVAVCAFGYSLAALWLPPLETPPIQVWTGSVILTTLASWTFSISVSPLLFGSGLLVGSRVGLSLAGGAVFSWGILAPFAHARGWALHPDPKTLYDAATGQWGARGWILWPGVAIMVGDSCASLALSWKTFVRTLTGSRSAFQARGSIRSDDVPNRWWMSVLLVAALVTVVVAWQVFAIPPYLTILAIVLSSMLANVACRAVGETDMNPIGPVAKITQLSFGAITTSMTTNLLAAGITAAGANQSGDLMQDLRSGQILGAAPRKQYIAQLVGIACGVLFAVPIYLLFDQVYEIGTVHSALGAPAAMAWKAVAEVVSKGTAALPPRADYAVLGGLMIGAALPIARKFAPDHAHRLPSGLALGLAFLVPAFQSIPIFLGAMFALAWLRRRPQSVEVFLFPVASGLIVGEGLAGLVKTLVKFAGLA